MRSRIQLNHLGLSLGLIGCCLFFQPACTTLGPDYQEPDIQALQTWETSLYGQVQQAGTASAIDLENWWQQFNDPVLNELVAIAHSENLNLQIAGLRILESRAALGIAIGSRYPQLQQLSGAGSYVVNERRDGNDDDFFQWQSAFTLGWEADFWGRFERSIESSNAAFFNSIANQQNVQVLLTTQVISTYFAYRTTQLQIEIAKLNAKTQKRSYDITEQLYNSGQNSELDLQQAKTQYMATRSSIPQLELAALQARNALCLLLARPPGSLPELTDEYNDFAAVSPPLTNEIPAALLMQRPDVRAAAWQIAVQSPQVGIAEAALYPAINLGGNVSVSGNSISSGSDTLTLGIGPSFTWNLFNYGTLENNVRVQDARLQQAIENFENVVLQAAQEIDNAAISLSKNRDTQAPLEASLKAAERSLEIATVSYSEGYADFQRVLDAQRAAAAQATNVVVNKGNQIAALVSLYGSLGAGWTEATIDGLIPESTRREMEARSDWGELLRDPLTEPDTENSN